MANQRIIISIRRRNQQPPRQDHLVQDGPGRDERQRPLARHPRGRPGVRQQQAAGAGRHSGAGDERGRAPVLHRDEFHRRRDKPQDAPCRRLHGPRRARLARRRAGPAGGGPPHDFVRSAQHEGGVLHRHAQRAPCVGGGRGREPAQLAVAPRELRPRGADRQRQRPAARRRATQHGVGRGRRRLHRQGQQAPGQCVSYTGKVVYRNRKVHQSDVSILTPTTTTTTVTITTPTNDSATPARPRPKCPRSTCL